MESKKNKECWEIFSLLFSIVTVLQGDLLAVLNNYTKNKIINIIIYLGLIVGKLEKFTFLHKFCNIIIFSNIINYALNHKIIDLIKSKKFFSKR